MFSLVPFARSYRVTDEALIAETMILPIYLMTIITALKGAVLIFIYTFRISVLALF